MSAMNAIRYNQEIRAYYLRKVEAGKNKMSIINAVSKKQINSYYCGSCTEGNTL
jgi:transposase